MTGSKEAKMTFDELYENFFLRIYNYARYRCQSEQEAEDLTSCIFEKVYKKFNTYNPGKAGLEVWVFVIARSVTVDFFRWKKFRSLLPFTTLQEETLTAPHDNPAENLEQDNEEKQLQEILQILSAQEREILNLHYYQHLKQTEIATIMNLTQSNVGVILHRAVKKIKMKFGNVYEE